MTLWSSLGIDEILPLRWIIWAEASPYLLKCTILIITGTIEKVQYFRTWNTIMGFFNHHWHLHRSLLHLLSCMHMLRVSTRTEGRVTPAAPWSRKEVLYLTLIRRYCDARNSFHLSVHASRLWFQAHTLAHSMQFYTPSKQYRFSKRRL